MAGPSDRRFPRLRIDRAATLEFRPPGSTGADLLQVPAAIRQISCEGVGLVVDDGRWPARGAAVTIRFVVDDLSFALPGRVAWLGPRDQRAPLDLGVHFNLALAPSAIRQTYATWIVDLLVKAQRRRPALPARGSIPPPRSTPPPRTTPPPRSTTPPRLADPRVAAAQPGSLAILPGAGALRTRR